MRAPGDILLLSTYELGHQPMLLASPLGFLRAAGFQPRAIDLAMEPLDEAAVRRARFVGIAVPMHTALRLGLEAAARIRTLNPAAHLCFYGLYAPLHRAHLEAAGAQSVLGGEYEHELTLLCEQLVAQPEARPRPITLERLRFAAPERAQLPALARYAHLLLPEGERVAGYVEASRGCLHLCRHCPVPSVYDGRFFVVAREVVLDDARRQIAAGARHLTFGDPDFLNGPGHVMPLVRALHQEFPDLSFDITTKVEHILAHAELFGELRALGCRFVVSAVESLSERVLTILDKGHTRADVDRALDIVRNADLTLRPSLLPFTPWSTLDDYLELLAWIEARDLLDAVDPIHLAIRLLVPPGSKLLELDEVRRELGPLAPDRLTYLWRHPDARMDALQAAALAAVERAVEAGEDPRDTFARVRTLAHAAATGRKLDAGPPTPSRGSQVRAPRLAEAWFC